MRVKIRVVKVGVERRVSFGGRMDWVINRLGGGIKKERLEWILGFSVGVGKMIILSEISMRGKKFIKMKSMVFIFVLFD